MPSLFVFRGNDQGVRFQLEDELIFLGRDPSNGCQLHDNEVSRRHASIRRDGDAFVLTDLNSSNGTFVNGRRIDCHTLASGDELQLGSTQLLFTGADVERNEAADAQVDIVHRSGREDRSRIVRTIPQVEGSRLFQFDSEQPSSPWLARARSNLQLMYRTTLAISHTLDIDQLLERIMQLIFEWVEADRGVIMLFNVDTGELEPHVRTERQASDSEERIVISQTILDYVLKNNEGVHTSDAQDDSRWNSAASIVQLGIREAICVPMQGRYHTVGVIYIDTSTAPQRLLLNGAANKFSDDHLKLMIAIAHQAALAVEDTRYYSAMVQAERLAAVGQTIATLSHHIKNILQGIRGGSYLIKEGLSQHDEHMVVKGWEFVEKNQERISNLVMDMLTFSKEREPEMVMSDLNRVVGDVVELMASRAQERGVELRLHPAPDIPPLTFDPEGLHRAVLNLVTNAIDACDPQVCDKPDHQGLVDVATQYDPAANVARIIVSDNGSGIPAEQLAQIFSLFMSTKGSRGTGLGLPVSQKILTEHGGRITVESTENVGSRFICELPTVQADSLRGSPMGTSPVTEMI